MKKAIFFDADGTITDMRTGTPSSAINALHQLTLHGHYAVLCTGRSRAMIPDDLASAGFNGIIAACGTYIEWNGQIILNMEMDRTIAKQSVRILREEGLIPILEGSKHLYFDLDEYNDSVDWIAPYIVKILGNHRRPLTGNLDFLDINKITAKILPDSHMDNACKRLSQWYEPIIHKEGFASSTVEFVPIGYSKATGIKQVCQMLQVPWEHTVCFGDSNNDLPMFKYAHTKVAMGNSTPEILKLADYITDDMEHHGIWNGLKHLKLI